RSGGAAGDEHPPGVDLEEEQDVQRLQSDRLDRQEVALGDTAPEAMVQAITSPGLTACRPQTAARASPVGSTTATAGPGAARHRAPNPVAAVSRRYNQRVV